MAKPTLTESDFKKAAEKLNVEIATIKAVAEVESKGAGFYANGFPVILFERHKFHKYTGGKFDDSHPELSNAHAGGYGPAGANQQRKFNEAFALDQDAAMLSCSWGKFQLMGFNFKVCGFNSVNEFVDAMKESEGEQLQAFVNFVIGNHLASYLRNKNWAKFAEGYNGSEYAKNKYDTKMAKAYAKHLKSPVKIDRTPNPPIDVTEGEKPTESTATATVQTSQGEIKQEIVQKNEQNVNEIAEVGEPKPQGFLKKLSAGVATIFGGTLIYDAAGKLSGIQFSTQTIYIIITILVLGFLGFCVWAILDAWKANNRTKLEVLTNTDVNRKNIKWVKPE